MNNPAGITDESKVRDLGQSRARMSRKIAGAQANASAQPGRLFFAVLGHLQTRLSEVNGRAPGTHTDFNPRSANSDEKSRRVFLILPWVFLTLGLIFRWYWVDYARFTGDEALFYRMAQQIVTESALPVLGPSVSGTAAKHPGATFYYLMALPNLISSHPRWSGMFISLLSVISLGLLVRMVRELRGEQTALITAWLSALSPWYILYSDRIWNSNVAPWLAIVVLFGLHRMVHTPKSRWVGIVALLLVILFQFHLSTPILWMAALGILVAARAQIHWRALILGTVAGALFYAPYLIYEVRHDFINVRAILSDAGGTEHGLLQPLRSFVYVLLFGTGDVGYHAHTGYWRPYDPFWQWTTGDGSRDSIRYYGWPLILGIWLSVGLCVWAWCRRLIRGGRNPRALRQLLADPVWGALILGSFSGATLLFVSHKAAYPHYVNLLLGVGVVPVAELLSDLANNASRLRKTFVYLFVALLGISMAVSTSLYYVRIDSKVGLATTLDIVDIISQKQSHEPFGLRFPYFNNRFPMSVLAEYAVGRPWLYQNKSKVVYEIRPKQHIDELPPEKADDLWDIGPVWLIRTASRGASR